MNNRKVSFDQLRALSAFFVVFSHACYWASKIDGQGGGQLLFNFRQGYGAILFMGLSAFLLTYIFTEKSNVGPLDFAIRRLLKITPLYWFFSTIFLVAIIIAPSATEKSDINIPYIVSSYFFIPYERPLDGDIKPFYSTGWTLNYIVLFYFIFSISRYFDKIGSIVFVPSAYFALYILSVIFEHVVVLQFWSAKYALLFVLCFLSAIVARKLEGRIKLSGLSLVAIFLASFAIHQIGVDTLYVYLTVSFVMMSFGLCSSERDAAAWQLVGSLSYSIILSHPFVLFVCSYLFKAYHSASPEGAYYFIAVSLLGSAIVGFIVYKIIETPLNRLSVNLSKRLLG